MTNRNNGNRVIQDREEANIRREVRERLNRERPHRNAFGQGDQRQARREEIQRLRDERRRFMLERRFEINIDEEEFFDRMNLEEEEPDFIFHHRFHRFGR